MRILCIWKILYSIHKQVILHVNLVTMALQNTVGKYRGMPINKEIVISFTLF